MNARIVDVDLENYRAIPRACRATVFWEFDHDDPSMNARFQKEEWFSHRGQGPETGRFGAMVAITAS